MQITRRRFLVASTALLTSAAADRNDAKAAERGDNSKARLRVANDDYLNGKYKEALAKYRELAEQQPHDADLKIAIGYCHLRLGDFVEAARAIEETMPQNADDLAFCTFVYARADDFEAARRAFANLAEYDAASDPELLEVMAIAAAKADQKAEAWQYFRRLQRQDPSSDAIDRLSDSGLFNFTSGWFGYRASSLRNYAKGFGNGAFDWGVDSAQGLWQLLQHPVDTVTHAASAIAEICTEDNFKLLLSPRQLAAALGDIATSLWLSAWEACKLSVARELSLDPDAFADQQKIHEIAAGRMLGYVFPELVLLLLSGGAGWLTKATKAERAAEAAKIISLADSKLRKVNLIGRSVQFLADAEKFPQLLKIHWLSEATWETLKASRKVSKRLESFVEWMSAVSHIPGAEKLVSTILSRLHLGDVDGYLFQLQRAAKYAKEGKLAGIGIQFKVPIALPEKPIKIMHGDADLVLTDGTLIETKLRNGAALALDEKLHKQLLKYERAVAEGQFKRIRLECNGPVSQQVQERCSVLAERGTPIEMVENITLKP